MTLSLAVKMEYLRRRGWRCRGLRQGVQTWENREWPASMVRPMATTSAYGAQKVLERRRVERRTKGRND